MASKLNTRERGAKLDSRASMRNAKAGSQMPAIIKKLKRDRYLYLLLIPFLAFYIVFHYMPMYGIQIAFKDYSLFKGIRDSQWVGFDNFKTYIQGEYFGRTVLNTVILNLFGLAFGFPAPIILALLLNEIKKVSYKRVIQTLVYLPHFISVVIIAGIVTNFLAPTNGIVNILIERLGGEKIYFLTQAQYFRGIYTSMNIWEEAGFGAVVYIAALGAIDSQLYDACVIDGGNRWRQACHVTIPGIMPTIIIMLILKIGHLMEVGYESVILLYRPATYKTADVISTYMYRTGLEGDNYSLATAVGLFNSVVGMILVYTTNKISNKVTDYGLW
jgi:putative aldouronate transport system permease protein